ncbi:Uncharacterised protein [Mycobacteroides abscessus subsp. abscessus]|nr:Uncharacterised protein [Mycobacteroides abscessus subsp. abscessus]
MAAAAPIPSTARNTPSTTMFGAMVMASDATMCRIAPAISGSRLPSESDSGPTSSCPRPNPTSVPVSVSWVRVELTCRSEPMSGRAGRYMSMVRGIGCRLTGGTRHLSAQRTHVAKPSLP